MRNARLLGSMALALGLIFTGTGMLSGATGDILSRTENLVQKSEDVSISVASSENELTELSCTIDDFSYDEVTIGGDTFWRLILGKEAVLMKRGMPALPTIRRSIIIPDDAKMDVRVTYADYELLDDVMVVPSKGNILRTVDPGDVPYEFGDIYSRDEWYPENIAELDEPYILRDFRGQVVAVTPFQYNPARHQLRVYNEVSVQVYPVGTGAVNVLDRKQPLTTIDSEFSHVYERQFLNYGPETERYSIVEEQGNMLVITYDSFWTTMEPFVAWKNMKGIPTEMVNVSEIGNNANSIKNYIRNYYNSKGLAYVLLVGDAAQVTTFVFRFGYENGASDPEYSYLAGNDHYPDLFVGRFSAQTTSQAATMVTRSIEYERNPQPGAGWYHQGVGIGSSEGPGDDGERDYQHIRNIRTDLIGYTYTAVDELYDGSQGGQDASGNPTTSMLSTSLNAGRSVINYCGHGWEGGWGTTGYGVGNVNSLTNDNMLPIIWSVACSNGAFDDTNACFAEAWLRATHNGEPTGAVGALMSSILQSWNPPMDGQDEMDDLLVESYADNIKRTFGGISFSGCMHMNDRYGGSGYEMTDTWHVFGDPSLEVRTDQPVSMTVSHGATISAGSNGFEVTVTGVEGALCALSRNSVFLGSGYTNGAGRALVHLDEPLAAGADLDLVVTGYNMIPYEATVAVDSAPAELYVDDSYNQFAILGGSWNFGSHPEACNGSGWFTMAGAGEKSLGWGVTSVVVPGNYDVYIWKFEHNFMSLMATDAHYKVYGSSGESDWILVDQSTPGNEWVYLGNFAFDNSSTQGLMLTNEANGVVIADVIKLVSTGL